MKFNDYKGRNNHDDDWPNGSGDHDDGWGSNGGQQRGPQQGSSWGQGGIGTPYRLHDRSYLAGLVPPAPPRPSARPGPLSQDAQRYSKTFSGADARAAAAALIRGGASSASDAVAEGIVDAAARSGAGAATLANAMASAAVANRGATAGVLARGAGYAHARGQDAQFADACSSALLASRRQGSVRSFGLAMADAVQQGGEIGRYTYGQAIAKAVSQGSDGQQAVAEATAEVFCQGGSYANAWASAFAVALYQDENGCLALSKAQALAVASCGGGAFKSYSSSDATSKVLGFCGLATGAVPGFSFNSGSSGSDTWDGK